jgi:hypothetical protein
MSPSHLIVSSASAVWTIECAGHRISLRRLNALDKLRLLKAAGPDLAQNEPWLGVAMLASSVTAIDDIPVPYPANERQIEAIVSQLGDEGLAAVAESLGAEQEGTAAGAVANAGN